MANNTLHTREVAAMVEFVNHYNVFAQVVDYHSKTPISTADKIALHASFQTWGIER